MDSYTTTSATPAPFLGTWQLISAVADGQPTPEEAIQNVRVVIADGSHTVYFGEQVVAHAVPFTIDLTVVPHRTTDFLPDGQKIHGIWRLEGDILTSCVSPAGQEPPEQFASAAGSGHILRVFKRVTA